MRASCSPMLRLLTGLTLCVGAGAPAWAQQGPAPCVAPFGEADFRALVEEAERAIDAGDVAAHRSVADELERQVPCLAGQLPIRPWADFLVTEATIRHADELPGWQDSLRLALDLVPDHPDVPRHVLRDYFPPADPPGVPVAIPPGRIVVLDGRILTGFVPPLQGLHIAQVVEDSTWRSVLLRGQPFPESWLGIQPDPVEPPPPPPSRALGSWGSVGVTGGFGSWGQASRDTTLLQDTSFGGTSFGASTHGVQKIASVAGVFWSAHVGGQSAGPPLNDPEGRRRVVVLGSAFAGVSLFDEPLSIWLGGGAFPTRLTEAPSAEDADGEGTIWVPHYLAGASWRAGDGLPFDISAGGGWGPWGAHAQAHAGASVANFGPVGLRVGANAFLGQATVVDRLRAGAPVAARVGTWSAGLDVGFAWGR